jgi:hypothetical protein
MDTAGVPADPKLRSAVLSFRSELSQLALNPGFKGKPRGEAIQALDIRLKQFGRPEADAEEILDSLLEKKILHLVKGRILPAARAVRRTSEQRKAAFEEFVTEVAARTAEGAEGRRLLAQLIRMMTRLHGVHRVKTSRGEGVFIGTAMDFVSGYPTVTTGVAVIVGKKRLSAYRLTSKRISLTWENDWPEIRLNLANARENRLDTEGLDGSRLVGDVTYSVLFEAARNSASASMALSRRREQIEIYIGHSLSGKKWNSLRQSLARRKPIGRMAHMSIVGMLDPDIRRIALRNPFATFGFYRWLKNADAETFRRRAQMSEAFPVFTYHLEKLDSVIRNGEPLIPALQTLTGLDAQRIKRFRGVHWQRLGRAMRALVSDSDHPGDRRSKNLAEIDPSRFPTSRKEWVAYSDLVSWGMIELLPHTKKRAALAAMSKNWVGYHELQRRDFQQSINDTAESLLSLIDHHLSTGSRGSTEMQELAGRILDHVAGENFGLKRLRLFNEAWHKGTGRRSTRLRELRKAAFGEERNASWKPLTAGAFACEKGRLVWLTDELQLLEEGNHMHHCVGSYWRYCVNGTSHIAQVHGADGSRSTVEFEISEEGRALVRQHHSYYDKDPSAYCHEVVAKFLSKHRKTRFEIAQGDPGIHHADVRRVRASEALIEELKELYADCLPMGFLNEIHAEGRLWMKENPDVCIEIVEAARRAREQRIHVAPAVAPAHQPRHRQGPAAVSVVEEDGDDLVGHQSIAAAS